MPNEIINGNALRPGIYSDVPFEDYLKIDALNNTGMIALKESPKHYRANIPLERRKSLVLGSLVHAGRLEPNSLAERYAVCPDYHLDEANCTLAGDRSRSKTTTYAESRVEDFTASHSDKEVVPREWYQAMQDIVAALLLDSEAHNLLSADGPVEETLVWQDAATGMWCKARMDKRLDGAGKFVDIKTTKNIFSFPKSFANFAYHRQFAHYQEGYTALMGEVLQPWIVVVESGRPYCVQSAPVDEEALEEGHAECRRLRSLLRECREKDSWPGPESPSSWRLPEWAFHTASALSVSGQKVKI